MTFFHIIINYYNNVILPQNSKMVMISSESIPIPKQNLLSFKVMQFESKIITGNGRQLTSRERVHISPGFIYFCEELRHSNEGSNSRASLGGKFVAGRKNSMCMCVCV